MPDVLRAMAISGAILLVVVVITVMISIVAVKRGEAEMAEASKQKGRSRH